MKNIQNISNRVNPDIILSRCLSDKFSKLGSNVYVFKVSKNSSKPDIKRAISTIFDVEVSYVNTLNRSIRTRSYKGFRAKSTIKYAYVYLKSGIINFDI